MSPEESAASSVVFMYFSKNVDNMRNRFFESISPGSVSTSGTDQIVPLLISKNPNTTVTNIAIENLLRNCSAVNLTSTNQTCDPGFAWDKTGSRCYKLLDEKLNFWRAAEACAEYGADLVQFVKDQEVQGLAQTLKSG